MKFFYTLSLSSATLMAAVSALPSAEQTLTIVPLDTLPLLPDIHDGDTPYVTSADGKVVPRNPSAVYTVGSENVVKRGQSTSLHKRSVNVDVWQDLAGTGRHEVLWVNEQVCLGLGNGWDNTITSLSVPEGAGCNFYDGASCDGAALTVVGGANHYIADLRDYGFDDRISSFLCWR